MKAKYAILLICLALLAGAGCAETGTYNPGGLLGASPYNPPIPPLNSEPAITPGTSLQYWRGDKTWQTLPLQVYPGAGVPLSTGTAWGSSYTVGTAANNLVQLNGSAQLPAVSGSLLTNIIASQVGAIPSTLPGTVVGDLAFSPGNLTFTPLTPPTAPTAALVTISGQSVTAGAHTVKVTYLTASGETLAGTASASVTADSTHTEISLSAIPTSASAAVTGRNIYMTTAGGSTYYLVSNGAPTLNNNTATTCTINVADATLGTGNYVAAPAANTTAGQISGANIIQVTPQTGAPATPATGTIAIADRANWDPLSKASGGPYPVWYNGSAWVSVAGQ